MKLKDLKDEFKVFDVFLMGGQIFNLTGAELFKFLKSNLTFYKMENGEGFNRSGILFWRVNVEKTREYIMKIKPKILVEKNA